LSTHGQWPWPRYKIAAIVDKLNQAGAAAIGIDIMFPEKDRTSLVNISADLKADFNLSIDFVADGIYPDNDHLLSQSISNSPTVLGYQFLFDTTHVHSDCRLHPLFFEYDSAPGRVNRFPWHATHVICNLNEFSARAHASGFFNMAPDADGILRSVPMMIAYKDHL
jgi:adenylate cyclase